MEIKVIEISGFRSALMALRLPFGKEVRSKTYHNAKLINNIMVSGGEIEFDKKDLTLMSSLIKKGDEHAKAIRGINVTLEINAPRYIWQELDTYVVGVTRLSSESTMHIQGKGLSEAQLVGMKHNLIEGTLQRRISVFNYQALRRIYFQRKDHRLPQWREFCKFIETLPYADKLITIQ